MAEEFIVHSYGSVLASVLVDKLTLIPPSRYFGHLSLLLEGFWSSAKCAGLWICYVVLLCGSMVTDYLSSGSVYGEGYYGIFCLVVFLLSLFLYASPTMHCGPG